MVEGVEYVPLLIGNQPLDAKVLASIRDVQESTVVGSYRNTSLVTMPLGWTATSIGGDLSKLIAVNPENGVAIKRYKKKSLPGLFLKDIES